MGFDHINRVGEKVLEQLKLNLKPQESLSFCTHKRVQKINYPRVSIYKRMTLYGISLAGHLGGLLVVAAFFDIVSIKTIG